MKKNTEIKYLVTFLLLLFFKGIHGQSSKNTIELYYSSTYSKTNFNNLPFVGFQDWLVQLYETRPPSRGIIGYYYGLNYKRSLNKNWRIGIGFNYSLNGQKSPRFFSIKGISDEDLMNIPDYGGTSYRITYTSYDFPLTVEYSMYKKGRISYFISGGISMNVYYRAKAENYLYSESTGKKDVGCCYDVYFHATGGKYKELKRHLKLGLWRTGFFAGGGIDYRLFPFLSVRAMPVIRVYTNLKDTSEAHTIVEGGLYNIGCNLSTNLWF